MTSLSVKNTNDKRIKIFEAKDTAVFEKEPYPRLPSRMYIAGPSASGKTNLLLNLILNKDIYWKDDKPIFTQIAWFSPTCLEDKSLLHLVEEPEIKDITFLSDKWDPELMMSIMEAGNSDEFKLFVIDDFASTLKPRDETLQKLFFQSRHYGWSIVLLSQNYRSLPKGCRINCSDIFVFNVSNSKELKILEEELSNNQYMGKDFIKMYTDCVSEPYSFMYRNRKGQFFKRFELISKQKVSNDENKKF